MKDYDGTEEGNNHVDIKILNNKQGKMTTLIEESPNQKNLRNSNNLELNNGQKEEGNKVNDTNYPIIQNNKGLFNQFEEPNPQVDEKPMTLDEPILTTLKRDLFRIYNKLKHVITPRLSSRKIEELYNWDLWGPLLFCFLLAISLSNEKNESSTFVIIFSIFWIGGLVVTFNGKFLGANIGICQMICLLGYCAFPITLGGIIIGFMNVSKGWIKCIIVFSSFLWSCLASVGFISALVPRDKELITALPIALFFVTLSLFVLNY